MTSRAARARAVLRPLAAVVVLLAGGVAVGADVASGGLLARLDLPLHELGVRTRPAPLVGLSRALSETGGWAGRTALGAGVLVVAAALRTRRPVGVQPPRPLAGEVLGVALALAAAPVVSGGLKRLVRRPRPPLSQALDVQHDFSFPSGHATGTAAVAVALAAVLASTPLGRSRRGRAGIVTGVALWTVAVGVSRVHLGAHWPTDVLAGWCVGAAIGVAAVAGGRAAGRRPRPPGPAENPGPPGDVKLH